MTTAPNIEMIASSLRRCSLNGGGGRRRPGRRREGGDDSDGVTVELNSDVALPYHWEQCLDIRTGQVYYINWEDGTRTTVDPRTSAFTALPTPRSTSLVSRRSRRASNPSSSYTSVSSVDASAWPRAGDVDSGYDNDNEEEEDDEDDEEEDEEQEESSSSTATSSSSSTGSSRGSAVSSTLSSFSPTDESASGDNGSAIGTGSDTNSSAAASGHVLVAAGCRACFMYFMVPKRADVCPKCGSSGLLHLSRSNGYP